MTNEPTTKTCSRCGKTFTGEIYLCVECDAELEKSEGKRADAPTTGEIVRALRCVAEATECKDCRYKYPVGNVILCDHEQMNGNAADRLESQERENASLRAENKGLHKEIIRRGIEIKTMTARAESAERERDAAIKELEVIEQDGLCSICKFESTIPLMECMENCVFKWRGLQPQEGEGK